MSSTQQVPAFVVQCLKGHIYEVKPGTELERKYRAHTALDALCLTTAECPSCVIDEEDHHRRFANTCAAAGCAFMDGRCSNGCIAALEAASVEQSPYEGQFGRCLGYLQMAS